MTNVNLGFALQVYSGVTTDFVNQLKEYSKQGLDLPQVISLLEAQATIAPRTLEAAKNPSSPAITSPSVGKTAGFVSVDDTARITGATRPAVYGWIKAGHIKPVKIEGKYFFQPSELNAYLSRRGFPLVTPESLTALAS